MEELPIDEEMRVVIVGAGGYGRVALDVLIASGYERRVLGFYDDAHAALSGRIRGYPILGDTGMLKSILSVEPVHIVVAITSNEARLRIANSLRALGGQFLTATHPGSYISDVATLGDGCVVSSGAVVHPDAAVGSHCYLGPGSVVDRDAEIGAGSWVSAGAVVGSGARVGARVVLGHLSSIGRKAAVEGDTEVGALRHVAREGG
jgi:sugar O-acyltransferase (sialic acid O-acetyltransferase NeuD family)